MLPDKRCIGCFGVLTAEVIQTGSELSGSCRSIADEAQVTGQHQVFLFYSNVLLSSRYWRRGDYAGWGSFCYDGDAP